jgi:hypothetical protein
MVVIANGTKLKEYLCSSPLCQYEACMNLKLSPLHPRIAGMSTTVLVCMKKGGEMLEGKTVTINGEASQNGQNWFKCNMTGHCFISVMKILYRLYRLFLFLFLAHRSDWLQPAACTPPPQESESLIFLFAKYFFFFFFFFQENKTLLFFPFEIVLHSFYFVSDV